MRVIANDYKVVIVTENPSAAVPSEPTTPEDEEIVKSTRRSEGDVTYTEVEPPEWDALGPPRGPCAFCSSPDARHRTVDTIVETVTAGDSPAMTAEDFGLTEQQVLDLVRVEHERGRLRGAVGPSPEQIEAAAKNAWHASVDEVKGWNPYGQWDDAFIDGFENGVKWVAACSVRGPEETKNE